MDGQAVFKLAVGVLEESARAVLAKAGRQEAEIDWLIPHQANIRIMQSTAKKLKLPMEKVMVTVDQHEQYVGSLYPAGPRCGRTRGQDQARRSCSCSKGWEAALPGVPCLLNF